jgi:hypothetical protein
MPFSTIPENILRKYIGAKALAEKGSTEGERAAARNAMQTMEIKYPTVRIESELFEQMERGEGPSFDPEPPPPPPPPKPPKTPPSHDPSFGPYTASSGNWGGAEKAGSGPPPPSPEPPRGSKWGSVMDVLGQAWDVAREVTESAVNAEAGRLYAEQGVSIEHTQTAAGNMRYTAVAPMQVLLAARYRFNDVQKQAFAKRIGERVAERVYAFLVAP